MGESLGNNLTEKSKVNTGNGEVSGKIANHFLNTMDEHSRKLFFEVIKEEGENSDSLAESVMGDIVSLKENTDFMKSLGIESFEITESLAKEVIKKLSEGNLKNKNL